MATHALDTQLQERLINQVAELERQLREMKTMQLQGSDAVNLTITNYYEATYDLPAGGAVIFIFTLTQPEDLPMFATFEYDAFLDTFAEANVIKSSFNNYADSWDVEHHTSYGYSTLNGSVVRERILVRNNSATQEVVGIRGRWRFVVSAGTGSTS